MPEPSDDFEDRNRAMTGRMAADAGLQTAAVNLFVTASRYEYSYHFSWLGRPIIQFPQDVMALQEIIWKVRPELIIETGIARGGSLIFYASMLELLGGQGAVVGIDVDIREPSRRAIEAHPLAKRVTLVEGSSVDQETAARVRSLARGKSPVMAVLDSNHTHTHVLGELNLYSPLVTRGSYLVVLDTIIEDMPPDFSSGRNWGKGNSPKSAVREFLRGTDRFAVDPEWDSKLLISVAPGGYLRCVKD